MDSSVVRDDLSFFHCVHCAGSNPTNAFIFVFIVFIAKYFHTFPLVNFGQQFLHVCKPSLKWVICKHEDRARCVISTGDGLFGVIKAILSNRNDLELIMNYIQTIV